MVVGKPCVAAGTLACNISRNPGHSTASAAPTGHPPPTHAPPFYCLQDEEEVEEYMRAGYAAAKSPAQRERSQERDRERSREREARERSKLAEPSPFDMAAPAAEAEGAAGGAAAPLPKPKQLQVKIGATEAVGPMDTGEGSAGAAAWGACLRAGSCLIHLAPCIQGCLVRRPIMAHHPPPHTHTSVPAILPPPTHQCSRSLWGRPVRR